MKNLRLNYETLIKITRSLTQSKKTEEIIQMTVKSIKSALDIKGCTLFLVNRGTNELEVAASTGLSREYLNKGAISALKSIADSLKDGPVAVYDVGDDPRIQYPEAAKAEGIASILSVPIMIGDEAIGAVRVYTAEKMGFHPRRREFRAGHRPDRGDHHRDDPTATRGRVNISKPCRPCANPPHCKLMSSPAAVNGTAPGA